MRCELQGLSTLASRNRNDSQIYVSSENYLAYCFLFVLSLVPLMEFHPTNVLIRTYPKVKIS